MVSESPALLQGSVRVPSGPSFPGFLLLLGNLQAERPLFFSRAARCSPLSVLGLGRLDWGGGLARSFRGLQRKDRLKPTGAFPSSSFFLSPGTAGVWLLHRRLLACSEQAE